MTPGERVGKTANVIIFLGILYTVLTLIALIGGRNMTAVWPNVVTLGMAMVVIGLGYGIRYGSVVCLYLTTGFFVCLVSHFGYAVVALRELRPALRLVLSGWALLRLYRSIPAMRILKQTQSMPLNTSRYGDFFLRRKKPF